MPDGGAAQEVEGLGFRSGWRFGFRDHRCDDRIAFVRQGDGQNRKRRLQRPRHRIETARPVIIPALTG